MSNADRLAKLKAQVVELKSFGPESTYGGYATQARMEALEAELIQKLEAEIAQLEETPALAPSKPDYRMSKVYKLADAVEADFWRRLREAFPEAAKHEGPPWTWAAPGVHAGERIRAAAEAMALDWLAVYAEEKK